MSNLYPIMVIFPQPPLVYMIVSYNYYSNCWWHVVLWVQIKKSLQSLVFIYTDIQLTICKKKFKFARQVWLTTNRPINGTKKNHWNDYGKNKTSNGATIGYLCIGPGCFFITTITSRLCLEVYELVIIIEYYHTYTHMPFTFVHTHTHTHIHTYMHTHTQAHTHPQTHPPTSTYTHIQSVHAHT